MGDSEAMSDIIEKFTWMKHKLDFGLKLNLKFINFNIVMLIEYCDLDVKL